MRVSPTCRHKTFSPIPQDPIFSPSVERPMATWQVPPARRLDRSLLDYIHSAVSVVDNTDFQHLTKMQCFLQRPLRT